MEQQKKTDHLLWEIRFFRWQEIRSGQSDTIPQKRQNGSLEMIHRFLFVKQAALQPDTSVGTEALRQPDGGCAGWRSLGSANHILNHFTDFISADFFPDGFFDECFLAVSPLRQIFLQKRHGICIQRHRKPFPPGRRSCFFPPLFLAAADFRSVIRHSSSS